VKFDRAGLPFIGGTAALAGGAALTVGPAAAVPLLVLAGFFAFFFRDPDRTPSQDPDAVVSPADGRVMVAGRAAANAAPSALSAGEWQQISIFLSPMDVHVNWIPVSGKVTRVEFRPGTFLPAYRPDATTANERSEVWIDHHGQTVVVRQIVGILARRVVCRVEPGREVRAGERMGIMKFGSRMDVYLPLTAQLLVKAGDRVRGAETSIARL
jgi:phosphatidylserine decarboxylase